MHRQFARSKDATFECSFHVASQYPLPLFFHHLFKKYRKIITPTRTRNRKKSTRMAYNHGANSVKGGKIFSSIKFHELRAWPFKRQAYQAAESINCKLILHWYILHLEQQKSDASTTAMHPQAMKSCCQVLQRKQQFRRASNETQMQQKLY